jgi:hypothetical protein
MLDFEDLELEIEPKFPLPSFSVLADRFKSHTVRKCKSGLRTLSATNVFAELLEIYGLETTHSQTH